MELRPGTEFLANVAGLGAGKAAQSLSKMLNTPVTIEKPVTAVLMSLDEVSTVLSEANSGGGLALCLTVLGELEGKVLITFPEQDISRVCRLFPRISGGYGPEHPMVRSALLEMCNILSSSFMSAIAEYTGLDYLASPPEMAIDMLDAIIISVLVNNQQSSTQVVFFDAELMIEVEPFRGKILYFPTDSAITKLMELQTGGER